MASCRKQTVISLFQLDINNLQYDLSYLPSIRECVGNAHVWNIVFLQQPGHQNGHPASAAPHTTIVIVECVECCAMYSRWSTCIWLVCTAGILVVSACGVALGLVTGTCLLTTLLLIIRRSASSSAVCCCIFIIGIILHFLISSNKSRIERKTAGTMPVMCISLRRNAHDRQYILKQLWIHTDLLELLC